MVSQELIEHLQTHSLDDLKRRLESKNKSVQRYFRLWQESRDAAEAIREVIRQKRLAEEQDMRDDALTKLIRLTEEMGLYGVDHEKLREALAKTRSEK